MHEMGVTREIVKTVVAEAERVGATEVRGVRLTIGQARDVVDEIFIDLFAWLARGTIAENAEIAVRRVPLTMRCADCGAVYPADVHDRQSFSCPRCKGARYTLHTGMEFSIDSLEIVADS